MVLPSLVIACGGPLGPIAGGRLSGQVVARPVDDWSFAADQRLVQVETRPDDPYSVNVAFALADGRLYLDLGTPDAWHRWRRFVRADPRVRLRIAGRVYAARLVAVTDPRELAQARAAFAARGIDAPAADATIVQAVGVAPAEVAGPPSSASRGGDGGSRAPPRS